MSSPPTNNQSTRLTSDRRRLSNNEISPANNSLNPRRIQTGLPGIRRTVYDGALRVNSDAYDVLSGTVRDVHANVVVAAVKKPRATYQDLQELRQVHQYMLTRRLAASPPTGPDKNGQEMDRQVTFQPTAGSNFGRKQEEVCRRCDSRRALLTAHYPRP